MSPPPWKRIGNLFDAALELPPQRRARFLEEACREEPEVLEEVSAMLRAHDRAEGVLEARLGTLASQALEDASAGLVRGRVVGPYELLREIGRGGMGVVYLARDRRLDRRIALKFLPDPAEGSRDGSERFLAEARAASALDHPGICTIHDVGETPDRQLYIAMAYYEGETLAQSLARGALTVSRAVEVFRQMLEALAHSHERGIVHRDIKPSNIMVTSRGEVKILDFGVAKLEGSGLTQPGVKVGTLAYMSPEQARGEGLDARTDLWSAGVVLFEMLAGRLPFEGRHDAAMLHAILYEDAASLELARAEGTPAIVVSELRAILGSLLVKQPGHRMASAGKVLSALHGVCRRLGVADPAPYSVGGSDPALPSAEGHGDSDHGRARPRSRIPLPVETDAGPPLPVSPTSLLGRRRELAQVLAALDEGRLVTLTGPPGTGKTRLAVEVAQRIHARYTDGVAFVALATVKRPGDVPRALAGALGLVDTAHRGLFEGIVERLRSREQLLLFDNFEHVVEAAPLVAELLLRCPSLRVLVTSQVVLRISGEYAIQVPPLDVPRQASSATPAEVMSCAATALFLDRARSVRPDFTVDEASAPVVAEICARLEGLPLAIELAAARVRLFPPRALLARLGRRLDLLKAGPRDHPVRHQTLRQAIAWTYDLLPVREQRFFRVMSVFEGGFSLEAAEAVGEALESVDAMDGIAALVDHSLVRAQGDEGEARYAMLETIREFGGELLPEDERSAAKLAHAEYFLRFTEDMQGHLTGPKQKTLFRQLEIERSNLRGALDHWRALDDPGRELRMATALWRFWLQRGQLREGAQILQRLLHGCTVVEDELTARAFFALGTLSHNLGENREARDYLYAALAYYRTCDHAQGVAETLNNLAWVACERAEFEDALLLGEDGLRENRRVGLTRGVAVALNNLGWVCTYLGRIDDAVRYQRESLELRRRHGDQRGVAFCLANLAWALAVGGVFERMGPLLQEAESIVSELDDPLILGWVLVIRCQGEWAQGELTSALATAERARTLLRLSGNSSALAVGLALGARVRLELAEVMHSTAGAGAGFSGMLEATRSSVIEGLELSEAFDIPWPQAAVRLESARLAAAEGDTDRAQREFLRVFEARVQMGDLAGLAEVLEYLSLLEMGNPARAARSFLTAARVRAVHGLPLPPVAGARIARLETTLRGALGQAAWKALELRIEPLDAAVAIETASAEWGLVGRRGPRDPQGSRDPRGPGDPHGPRDPHGSAGTS